MKLYFALPLLVFMACEKDKSKYGQGIFDFDSTEIVSESTPDQLESSTNLTQAESTSDISQLKDRLYLSEAGNSIPNMIASFQERIDELNARVAGYEEDAVPACIGATPETASITTPDGQAFAMKVQCYEELSDTSFMIWGKDDDNVSYIYERGPVTASVVKVTPNSNGTSIFDGYLSFLPEDRDDAGTIVHIIANESTKTVQANMVAPHEVCGVNMYADAEKIHFTGSISTGTANSCPAEQNYVYNATDLSESSGFDSETLLDDDYFMKRVSGNKLINGAETAYEEYANTSDAGNVSLTYNADASASTTDVNFGPEAADELGGSAFVSP